MSAKISDLDLADALSGSEIYEVVQGGESKRATADQVKSFISALVNGGNVEQISAGLAADRPAAGNVNHYYISTDTLKIEYDSGSTWVEIARAPANIGAGDLGFDPATQAELDAHTGNTSNPHSVTKAQAGLGNVTNDAQLAKDGSITATGALPMGGFKVTGVGAPTATGDVTRLDDTTFRVDNTKALVDATTLQVDGLQASVRAFYSDTDTGGGHFYWDADRDKSTANGGTIIDPDTVGTLSATALGTFLSQQGTGSGTGCWVRLHEDTLNLTWFGATGNGTDDDGPSLRATADALSALGGGVMEVPEGTYLINSGNAADLASNVVVRGHGRSSLFKRGASHGDQMIFRINGTDHVTVQDTACDFNNAGEFFRYVGLRGDSPNNIRYLRNRIFDSNPDTTTGGDKWAFNLSAQTGTVENLWVIGNHSSNDMQLISGGNAMKNIWVTDNVCTEGRSNGLAITQLGDNETQENIWVERNHVEGVDGNGIIIGPDANSTARSGNILRNVSVRDNVVFHNDSSTNNIGIDVRHQNTLENVTLSGNLVYEAAASRNSGTGIRVSRDSTLTPSAIGENISIYGNTVFGYNIGYSTSFCNVVSIDGNISRDCNRAFDCIDTTEILFTDNRFAEQVTGIRITGTSTDIEVRGNHITDVTGDFNGGIVVDSGDTVAITMVGNRVTKSGTNNVYGYVQQGGGTYTSDALLNDFSSTDGFRLVSGSLRTRWLNRGDTGDRMAPPAGQATATTTWDPGSIADGAVTSTTVSVTTASPGDLVIASHDQLGANDVLLSAHVESSNTVRVVLHNKTGGAFDLGSGTLRVMVTSF